ncbi:substrate-binding domain-containing protein [Pusillimonas sp. TS35]|uniref:LacI family DNA-binding transcriptional regulator n=1 Tax=Paracandidimonas lactea TaxID=2895524 RepID=UPI00136DFBBF|nr:LacI family DNA-binding transcriptional regulator [Paracandidimonas lactea]MYN12362.1 substrate-binding domain-containing protein [Pusillimonas sp. TS35]
MKKRATDITTADTPPGMVASSVQPPRHVRMRDVAKMAGVAVTTVSRVLTEPQRVSPKTMNAVMAAIETLGYLPNRAAGSLRSNRSNMIAVLVPNISHSAFAETLQGMADRFRDHGYQLLIGHTGYSLKEEEDLVATLLSRRPDGIVLTGYTHTETTTRLLKAAQIPIVEMWNLCEDPLDMMVGYSNFGAARTMTQHLLERGYRRIGYIGGLVMDNDRTRQREAGFMAALTEAGIEIDRERMERTDFEFEAGAISFRKIMQQRPDTEAIFASSDILAVGVLLECAKLGWPVPGRLAVAGFDDSPMASLMTPSLTTIRVHKYEIGDKVAELVLNRLDGEAASEPARIIDVGFEVVARDSVGRRHDQASMASGRSR